MMSTTYLTTSKFSQVTHETKYGVVETSRPSSKIGKENNIHHHKSNTYRKPEKILHVYHQISFHSW